MFWGENGLFIDLVMTVVFMTFMMTLAMTPLYRGRISKGKAPATSWLRSEHPVLRLFPGPSLFRAIAVAIVIALILLPASTVLLLALKDFPISFGWMIAFKSIYGALIGLVVTPLIAICAMSDKRRISNIAGA